MGLSGPDLACSGCFLKFSSVREKQVALRKIQAWSCVMLPPLALSPLASDSEMVHF